MTRSNVPQFWHFSWPTEPDEHGCVSFMEGIGQDEMDARMQARAYSRGRHATVTNREGLVATYVDGVERFFDRPDPSAKVQP